MARLNRIWQATLSASQASSVCTLSLLSLPSTSMAVRHRSYMLPLTKGARLSKPSVLGNFSASRTWSPTAMTGCGARSTPLWSTGTSSGKCQKTETHTVRACQTPWQPLQDHPCLEGGRSRCYSHQRKGWMDNVKEWMSLPMPELLQWPPAEKTGRGSMLIHPSRPTNNPISQGTELNQTEECINYYP